MPRKKQSPSETEEASTKTSTTRQSKARLIKKSVEKSPASGVNSRIPNVNAERSVPSSSPPPEALYPRVASRAYELYQRRGGHHGQDLHDWFEAEHQVLSEEL